MENKTGWSILDESDGSDKALVLRYAFDECWSRDTSSDKAGWTPDNPSYGHCAVAVLTAEKMLGGTILRYSLKGTPYEHLGSHYRLRLSDEEIFDPTEDQFLNGVPDWKKLEVMVRTREELLNPTQKKNEGTIERYPIFEGRVKKKLDGLDAAIFE